MMMQTQQANSTVELEAVQRKAYELWLQGGCREGVAEQNWNEAVRLVQGTQPQQATQPLQAATPTRASEPPSSPRASSSSPMTHPNNKKSMKRH
jgi:hypothetical protein